jgi:hypothetical protein
MRRAGDICDSLAMGSHERDNSASALTIGVSQGLHFVENCCIREDAKLRRDRKWRRVEMALNT